MMRAMAVSAATTLRPGGRVATSGSGWKIWLPVHGGSSLWCGASGLHARHAEHPSNGATLGRLEW